MSKKAPRLILFLPDVDKLSSRLVLWDKKKKISDELYKRAILFSLRIKLDNLWRNLIIKEDKLLYFRRATRSRATRYTVAVALLVTVTFNVIRLTKRVAQTLNEIRINQLRPAGDG